jgi:hypothetical protein
MNGLPKPVYKIQTVSSSVEPIEWKGLQEVANSLKNGYLILWQHHGIFTGKVEEKLITWLSGEPEVDDSHFVRLRAFNEWREYHYWKVGQVIKGRIRFEEFDKANPCEVIDSQMILKGIVGEPLKKVSASMAEHTIVILTRNYIGYNPELHQAGYVDSRFVNFQLFNPKGI